MSNPHFLDNSSQPTPAQQATAHGTSIRYPTYDPSNCETVQSLNISLRLGSRIPAHRDSRGTRNQPATLPRGVNRRSTDREIGVTDECDVPPLDAAYWQRRYEIERDAMLAAYKRGDWVYAVQNAKTYWRCEANAIAWASRSEDSATGREIGVIGCVA